MQREQLTKEDAELLSPQEIKAIMDCGCAYVEVKSRDLPDEFTEITIHARKLHFCDECGFEILPGELFTKSSGIWRGNRHTFKTCACCRSLRDAFFCETYIFGQLWTDFEEYLHEMRGEIPSDVLVKLPDRLRYRVFHMLEKIWALMEGLNSPDDLFAKWWAKDFDTRMAESLVENE